MNGELHNRDASGTELMRANTPIAKASHVRRPPAAIKTFATSVSCRSGATRSEFAPH